MDEKGKGVLIFIIDKPTKAFLECGPPGIECTEISQALLVAYNTPIVSRSRIRGICWDDVLCEFAKPRSGPS